MPIRLTGMNSGLDTDSIVEELVAAYSKKTEKYEKEQTKLSWKQEIWKDLNKKVRSFYNSVSNLRFSSAYNTKKTTVSDSTKASVKADGNAVVGAQTLNVLATAQSGYLTGGKIALADGSGNAVANDTKLSALGFTEDEGTFSVKSADGSSKTITLTKDSTVADAVQQLKDAGLSANFDEKNGRIFVSSMKTGEQEDFNLVADNADVSKQLLGALGLDASADGTAKKIDGNDAVIVLSGVEYRGSSNNFSINGLNISVTGVTDANALNSDGSVDFSKISSANAVTINTSVDTQGLYDKVKDFLTEYNNIINEITKLYNADSARNYQPLTDEEKDAMSETEVEQWESKIKDSLLRRDDSLNSIMSAMTTAMSKTIELDGKKYSLASFGIKTLGFLNAAENEQNAFHIDGDEDDENTSGNADKLMAAITNDPDTVTEFMKQLSTNLYTAIDERMERVKNMRSRYSIYNDLELDRQYKEYTKTIKTWEEKVEAKREYYYKQFSAMETALATLQNQTNSLAGLLGS